MGSKLAVASSFNTIVHAGQNVGTTVKAVGNVFGWATRHPAVTLTTAAGTWHVLTYIIDVNFRRWYWAKKARAAADKRGKPMLNLGSGSKGTALFGATKYGDINCDFGNEFHEKHCEEYDDESCFCDATHLPYEDKQFGSILVSHVLEHISDYQAALREFHRVADEVFIVTPLWWSPTTWAYWDHRWYFKGGRGEGKPLALWRRKETAEFRGKTKTKPARKEMEEKTYHMYIPGYVRTKGNRIITGLPTSANSKKRS